MYMRILGVGPLQFGGPGRLHTLPLPRAVPELGRQQMGDTMCRLA
jgi:hypothetical protein